MTKLRPKSRLDPVAAARDAIARHRMLSSGDGVVVACSGGADSMALLLVLAELAQPLGLKLYAVTVDHGLRDATSEHGVVAAVAQRLRIPHRVEQVVVPKVASPMQAAREVRLAALERVARGVGAKRIATGHTASDQAETVLMRALRGSGTRGLAGIPPVRGAFVRPLLWCGHDDLVAWLAARGERWSEDPTNTRRVFTRNRVRLDVVPVLRELAPDLERRLSHVADAARDDRAALDQLAEQALREATTASGPGSLGLDLGRLLRGPRGLLPHVLRRGVERVRRREGQLYRAHLEALCDLASGRSGSAELHLPGATALREYGTLHLRSGSALQMVEELDRMDGKEIVGPGCYRVGRILLTVDLRPVGPPDRDPWVACFDAAEIVFPLVFRHARRGEALIPFGMTGRKLLSDLLTEARVPRAQRGETWVLSSGDQVLWVAGIRRSAHHPVGVDTREMVVVRATSSQG